MSKYVNFRLRCYNICDNILTTERTRTEREVIICNRDIMKYSYSWQK